MRTLLYTAAIAALIAVGQPLTAAADVPLAVGKPAPPIALLSVDGKSITLAQFKGRPLYVNFFASWCQPCKLELPFIVKQYPAYKSRVAFLGIDELESPAQVNAFVKQIGLPYLIGLDPGPAGSSYEIQSLPKSIFIDKHGIVRAIWRGYITPTIFRQNMDVIAGSP
ncbi:MAG TPA: TlpA disulfide reductase family protein [Candidatus Eremiobacteraceae bacterium]|nr:TlpA disulfide reductase family protein [Candidatus Eremiobacteraceae bacterium]